MITMQTNYPWKLKDFLLYLLIESLLFSVVIIFAYIYPNLYLSNTAVFIRNATCILGGVSFVSMYLIFFKKYKLSIRSLWNIKIHTKMLVIWVTIQIILILQVYFRIVEIRISTNGLTFALGFNSIINWFRMINFTSPEIVNFLNASYLIYCFAIIFPIPFFEEVLFRGVLLNYVCKVTSAVFSVVFTTSLFVLIHFQGWNISAMFFSLNWLVLTVFYAKTKSLKTAFLLHAFNNLIVVGINTFGVLR